MTAIRWKVVNRHGQKPSGLEEGFVNANEASHAATRLNAAGYDDGPFTVTPWGTESSWYSVEGYDEALSERQEEA